MACFFKPRAELDYRWSHGPWHQCTSPFLTGHLGLGFYLVCTSFFDLFSSSSLHISNVGANDGTLLGFLLIDRSRLFQGKSFSFLFIFLQFFGLFESRLDVNIEIVFLIPRTRVSLKFVNGNISVVKLCCIWLVLLFLLRVEVENSNPTRKWSGRLLWRVISGLIFDFVGSIDVGIFR